MKTDYLKSTLEIVDVTIKSGKTSGNQYFADNYPNTPVMVFTLKIDKTVDHTEYQLCSLTEDGLLKNPIRPEYVSNGVTHSATLAYDFVKAIEESLGKEKAEELKKKGFTKARFVGIPFQFGVKEITGKDSGIVYHILETSRQKQKDSEYKGAGGEAFDIASFNKALKEVKVEKPIHENNPIDQSQDDKMPWDEE